MRNWPSLMMCRSANTGNRPAASNALGSESGESVGNTTRMAMMLPALGLFPLVIRMSFRDAHGE